MSLAAEGDREIIGSCHGYDFVVVEMLLGYLDGRIAYFSFRQAESLGVPPGIDGAISRQSKGMSGSAADSSDTSIRIVESHASG